ncbi:unnamed protein product [Brugia pahangi]|uniref:GDNF domain-containing protein n=1 Tax=Brugia pahangi TaxID=6280 RepID=A0A0N4TGY1_BRUPA|nr:unnamed protein product [Brugia pahangi]
MEFIFSTANCSCPEQILCSSRYGIFTSECESEASHGDCSLRCRELLNDTLKTQHGAAFIDCTCTDKDDKLCQHLKDVTLKSCMMVSKFHLKKIVLYLIIVFPFFFSFFFY